MYTIETHNVPLYTGDEHPWHACAMDWETGRLLRMSGDFHSEEEAIADLKRRMEGWICVL